MSVSSNWIRDWIWYQTWGRYAWNCHRDRTDEMGYWNHQLGKFYGTSDEKQAIPCSL